MKTASHKFLRLLGMLLVGGAGFLGYYLVQSVLHWNATEGARNPIRMTVYDNFIRGLPPWLTELTKSPNFTLVKHDITHPFYNATQSQ